MHRRALTDSANSSHEQGLYEYRVFFSGEKKYFPTGLVMGGEKSAQIWILLGGSPRRGCKFCGGIVHVLYATGRQEYLDITSILAGSHRERHCSTALYCIRE